MYRDSPIGLLYIDDYYKEVEGFIYFIPFNLNNINGGGIRFSCVKCKNKKFHQLDVMMMRLLKKGFIETENLMFCTRPC